MEKKAIKTAFLDTIPVLTGYVFLGIGFGILLGEAGYGILWSFAMSVFVFAGSAQYMAVSLLASHASLISVALATFLLNARHIFYGISLIDTYKDTGKEKPYLIFALTDETYTLVTQNQPPEGMTKRQYCLVVSALDHLYWITGCVLGSLVGKLLSISYEGIEFVLTALFVTMFTEQWLKGGNRLSAIIGVGCSVACLLLLGSQYFLIPAMVLIALCLTVSHKTGRRASHD